MKVTAIVPAYNEESRIEKVIIPALKTDMLSNIIVVDDGSEDLTSKVVSKYDVDLIKLSKNIGKTGAVKEGIRYCKEHSDIIVLLDADLIGLTPSHIKELILPVVEENIDMTIGIFKSGRYITDLAQTIAPNLSGQRAIKTSIANEILDLEISGYAIEVALSKLTKDNNLKVKNVIWRNVSHRTKEEKIGLAKGVIWRIKMYKDIIKYWMH